MAITPQMAIAFAYSDLLFRDPDPQGEAFWVKELEKPEVTFASMKQAIQNSDEFRARQLNPAQANINTVRAVYRKELGRKADAEGLAFWAGRLNAGMGYSELILSIRQSDEFKNKGP